MPQPPTPHQLQLLHAGTVIDGVLVVPKAVRVLGNSNNTTSPTATNSVSSSDTEGAAAGAPTGRGQRRVGLGRTNSSRTGSGSSGSSTGGRCVLQLDVSEGKKHEVRVVWRFWRVQVLVV